MATAVPQPCQKCGLPTGTVTYFIRGERLCGICYSALLAKDTRDTLERHRRSLDRLGPE